MLSIICSRCCLQAQRQQQGPVQQQQATDQPQPLLQTSEAHALTHAPIIYFCCCLQAQRQQQGAAQQQHAIIAPPAKN
jgi:hypothetical protein